MKDVYWICCRGLGILDITNLDEWATKVMHAEGYTIDDLVHIKPCPDGEEAYVALGFKKES